MAFWRSTRSFIAVIYSLIPYKTPWLALNFWLPIALFAGLAIEVAVAHAGESIPQRVADAGLCILVGAVVARRADRARHAAARLCLHPADEEIRMPMPTPRKICSDCLRRSQNWRARMDSHRRASL
jgi:predicted membrane-bound mannosyltransferase